ncbi:polyphosphate polymerase domain-containing protein [Polaribacter sp.]|uniref:polyphosphate polymerase domain-containing protein n=1 Tax=Polaribacter sp. TaxID=1920175 RepID=UPI0040475FF0
MIVEKSIVNLKNNLNQFQKITLDEMNSVALLKRKDTKFIINISYLPEILETLKNSYRVLEIDGKRIMNYSSLYLDTPDFKFYNDHHNGRINRTKIRQRKYVDSNLTFIEIKKKNGKGETDKFRKQIADFETELSQKSKDFIFKITSKNLDLQPSLWNDFKRITLVNLESKERVTIDLNLSFSIDAKQKVYSNLVVIELKQAKFDRTSEVVKLLKSIQCNPYSISKYCVGATNLYQDLKNNLIKPKLLKINKLSL